PLRMRRDDIPNLLRHFLARFCAEEHRTIHGISGEAMAGLSQLNWPGNIRQLENAVYRAVVMSEGEQLGLSDFPLIGAQPAADTETNEPLVMEPVFQRAATELISGNEIPISPLPDAGSLAMLAYDGD